MVVFVPNASQKNKKLPITTVIHDFRFSVNLSCLALCLPPQIPQVWMRLRVVVFFYQKAKVEVSGKPQEEWLIPAQCRKLLSGASVAAAEVYHHGYLISQRRLRDQQGQFSALSTLLSFFDVVRRHPLDLVSHSMSAQRKSPERKT